MKTAGRIFYGTGACLFLFAYVGWHDKLAGRIHNFRNGPSLYAIHERCSGPEPMYSAASCAEMMYEWHGYLPFLCLAVICMAIGTFLNKKSGDVVSRHVDRLRSHILHFMDGRQRR